VDVVNAMTPAAARKSATLYDLLVFIEKPVEPTPSGVIGASIRREYRAHGS
jgi:hypothetical protein